ncbi:MAG: FAD-binding protein [Bacteroidales bacterium]|nr:FAD-binding protein [Bacteroidales bacterium]
MVKEVSFFLTPEASADERQIKKAAARRAGVDPARITDFRIIRKSIDARHKAIKVNFTVELSTGEGDHIREIEPLRLRVVSKADEVIIIGAGPAGLFAALRLCELGLRPVILERGRDVSERKKDIARISREHVVDSDSNYCFGEGGAGTFSDGKLYTRSQKRGNNLRVLELFRHHGAPENILFESHPHIGSDKLPAIISSIRKSILDAGGLILFNQKVTDLICDDTGIKGVRTTGGENFLSENVIAATGHSARDIYELFQRRGVAMAFKPFAMGVRVEHPQELIDRIQYHGEDRGNYLPAAAYSLVQQVNGRGVWSFCMCPGGFIIPAATSQEEVVVNGMSASGRNSPYANSGIVVEIRREDLIDFSASGEMAGLELQRIVERMAWKQGGCTQSAPAQRLADFIDGRFSPSLPKASYFPGIISSALHEWLPGFMSTALREGFRLFGRKMKGFVTNEAVVAGVESRTSSPLRVLRDDISLESVNIKGLYPCGEGAGYAGGIVSSAVDGMRVAEAIAAKKGLL